jgi:hypothetical protein
VVDCGEGVEFIVLVVDAIQKGGDQCFAAGLLSFEGPVGLSERGVIHAGGRFCADQ